MLSLGPLLGPISAEWSQGEPFGQERTAPSAEMTLRLVHYAYRNPGAAVVAALVRAGASPGATDKDGHTARQEVESRLALPLCGHPT